MLNYIWFAILMLADMAWCYVPLRHSVVSRTLEELQEKTESLEKKSEIISQLNEQLLGIRDTEVLGW